MKTGTIKIEYKIFLVVFLSILCLPILFFSGLLIKVEYDEFSLYGSIEEARIINIHSESGSRSGEYGDHYTFDIEILNSNKFKDQNYSILLLVDSDSALQNKKDLQFVSNAKTDDLITVKILNSHQAKILTWKGKSINSKMNYSGKFWRWVLILILILMLNLLFYKIYKTIKK